MHQLFRSTGRLQILTLDYQISEDLLLDSTRVPVLSLVNRIMWAPYLRFHHKSQCKWTWCDPIKILRNKQLWQTTERREIGPKICRLQLIPALQGNTVLNLTSCKQVSLSSSVGKAEACDWKVWGSNLSAGMEFYFLMFYSHAHGTGARVMGVCTTGGSVMGTIVTGACVATRASVTRGPVIEPPVAQTPVTWVPVSWAPVPWVPVTPAPVTPAPVTPDYPLVSLATNVSDG